MEKKENKLIGLFDGQALVLIAVGELKAAGFEEEELNLVAKHDEQINLLIDHTAVHIDTQDRENFKGKVIAFLASDDITKDAFNQMGLDAEETDYYFQQVENGKLLLYTSSEPASTPSTKVVLPVAETEERHLALQEERSSTEKKNGQTGKFHVHKQKVEEDKELQVPVEREEIVIERQKSSAQVEKDQPELAPAQAYEKDDTIYFH